MASKRPTLTSYKIAGRDEPTVLASSYRRSVSQPAKAKKPSKKRKRGPTTISFTFDGTLNPPANDSPSSPPAESKVKMAELALSHLLKEIDAELDATFEEAQTPADADSNNKKVWVLAICMRSKLILRILADLKRLALFVAS
ncbi:hypothetical protein FRC12_009512 [Ceratobasidium sp. 428]|nr:hypothetical protein FRC12_009512 [Ceratobasidium sp. 428]